MNIKKLYFYILIMLFFILGDAFAAEKIILGKTEKVVLMDSKTPVDAKLDTGASMSSFSATAIKIFYRNQQAYVRFTFYSSEFQKTITLIKPLIRHTAILKRKEETMPQLQSKYSIRPVVALSICMGNQVKDIQVNLTDRSDFRHPLLIGSNDLKKFKVLVDVERRFVLPPRCLVHH
jgi:hypothetical protein